jgi:hypothetical protein
MRRSRTCERGLLRLDQHRQIGISVFPLIKLSVATSLPATISKRDTPMYSLEPSGFLPENLIEIIALDYLNCLQVAQDRLSLGFSCVSMSIVEDLAQIDGVREALRVDIAHGSIDDIRARLVAQPGNHRAGVKDKYH